MKWPETDEMRCSVILLLIPAISCVLAGYEETDIPKFFARVNSELRVIYNAENAASYKYNTNVTEDNRRSMIKVFAESAIYKKRLAHTVRDREFIKSEDPHIVRQATLLQDLGVSALNPDDYLKFKNAISAMESNFATTTVCSYTNRSDCSLALEPHIQERIAHSRDPDELAWYWREWYDKAGTPMRKNFAEYVQLAEKAAHLNDYKSFGDYWLHFYEDEDFERKLDKTFDALLPLYRQVHGYVRYRLREEYGPDVVSAEGNIPMHLLGDMWGQEWENILDLCTPYPEKPFVDVKSEMLRQNYTVNKLFELGDQFFQSLGMRALPPSFWNLSVFTRPADREVVCHASAWDLYQDSDVRIKMCAELDNHYLYVVHHELGHIQYYLQFEHQPAVFRDSPNPGFHEAVGDVIALSVMSAKHLKIIGLSSQEQLDEKSRINELFKQALNKIVFLPFSYTMDKYRFAVFNGELLKSQWNCGFWQMRSLHGGIEPPVWRDESNFDPPAKYHVSGNVEYLRYFAAHIFQFQFHRALCRIAGQYVPGDNSRTLDNCDIFGSKKAGQALHEFLSAGNSKHWKVVLEEFTGETEMDPSALLEYFEPLYKWLKQENSRLGVPLGWDDTHKISPNCLTRILP